jgi:hypothetical protein
MDQQEAVLNQHPMDVAQNKDATQTHNTLHPFLIIA